MPKLDNDITFYDSLGAIDLSRNALTQIGGTLQFRANFVQFFCEMHVTFQSEISILVKQLHVTN